MWYCHITGGHVIVSTRDRETFIMDRDLFKFISDYIYILISKTILSQNQMCHLYIYTHTYIHARARLLLSRFVCVAQIFSRDAFKNVCLEINLMKENNVRKWTQM